MVVGVAISRCVLRDLAVLLSCIPHGIRLQNIILEQDHVLHDRLLNRVYIKKRIISTIDINYYFLLHVRDMTLTNVKNNY